MPALAPSILSADFARLGEEIAAVEEAGARLLHLDVMDGHFVPNLTIGPPVVAAVRRVTRLPLDVHLMIEDADRYIESFVKAGADMISVHQEATPHLHRTVAFIRECGAAPGVVLNPATPLTTLQEILPELDYVLLMSVNPGFGGQKFIPSVLRKTAILKSMIEASAPGVRIEIDGGVGLANISDLLAAGAGIFVAGSAVYDGGDPRQRARDLIERLARGRRAG
ncbi:MAG TPA: ribulose-phosphate 3-epimerase [Candidatus Polarisedimenticolia bacterium]|nr:ribulose-phosphate 3-epimerase [Candidatus Polarisedimenticolia bacterium]